MEVKKTDNQAYWTTPPQNIPKKPEEQDLFEFRTVYSEQPATTTEQPPQPQNPFN